MAHSKSLKYTPLPYDKFEEHNESESSSQADTLLEHLQPNHVRDARRSAWRARALLLVANISILANIVMIFIGIGWQLNFPRTCLKYTDYYSPGLDVIDPEPIVTQFNGTLRFPSPYTGEPSEEIDAAWEEIEATHFINVSAEELFAMGWDPSDGVRVPDEYGGGYMAYPEVTHMLHCVSFLRKSTWPDYYNRKTKASIEWDDTERTIRLHKDHCAELLRQAITCKADVTLMTYNKVKNYPKPLPDFSTRHKCRNFPSVLDWIRSRAIPVEPPEYDFPYLPETKEYSKPPQPDVWSKMHPDTDMSHGRPVAY